MAKKRTRRFGDSPLTTRLLDFGVAVSSIGSTEERKRRLKKEAGVIKRRKDTRRGLFRRKKR